jgi:hypothetical protein
MSALIGRVKSVRVYIDRAAVTRVRSVKSSAELREVVFAPVPENIEIASLRARVVARKADGTETRVRVIGVSSVLIYRETVNARHEEVARAMADIDSRVYALDDAEGTETHVTGLLETYAAVATGQLSREWLDRAPAFDRWGDAFDHLRKATEKLAVRRAMRKLERAKLFERRADLLEEEHRFGRRETLGYRMKVAIENVPVDAEDVEVELTYVTRAAQWMPIYDARFLGEHVELTAIALVRQNTGEDWNGVELIATTARPPLSEPLPELKQVGVRGHPRAEQKMIVSTHTLDPRLAGASSAAEAAPEVEFAASGVVNVPSTNRPVRAELFTAALPARSRLEVAPMSRPVAILVADVENTSGRVLLPGKVNVFRGDAYAGEAQLGFLQTHERFLLPLGTDASVRIRREVVEHPEKHATLTGTITRAYTSRTTLENLGPVPLDIVVRDMIPVSRAAEAVVRVAEIDRGAEVDQQTGATRLSVRLAAKERREVPLAFSISAPRGFQIQAGRSFSGTR